MTRFSRICFALTASFLLVPSAQSATVVVDFDGVTQGFGMTADYFEDGFKMKVVSDHYDFLETGGTGNSAYVGIDNLMGIGSTAAVRFTRVNGGIFDLTSLDVVAHDPFPTLGASQWITSSASGNMLLNTLGIVNFSGVSWTDLTWIQLNTDIETLGGAVGFDTLTFAIPIPAAVWLFGSAIGLLGWMKRKAA